MVAKRDLCRTNQYFCRCSRWRILVSSTVVRFGTHWGLSFCSLKLIFLSKSVRRNTQWFICWKIFVANGVLYSRVRSGAFDKLLITLGSIICTYWSAIVELDKVNGVKTFVSTSSDLILKGIVETCSNYWD